MPLQSIKIKIKRIHPEAKIPTISTSNAAGFDIYSVEDYELQPGETKAIHSGITMEIPEGKAVFMWDRSGMGFKGIHKFAGLIDSDYRGEFNIILCNYTKEPYHIKKGDRIAQGVIQDYYTPEFKEVSELSDSKRGEGWNSSTGR